MQVFVTGCASFVGKELLRLCKSKGVQVSGVDLLETNEPGCTTADIRSSSIVDHIPHGVDAVIHLAALSRDADCRDKAYKCFDANVMGTLNLIDAAKIKGTKQFIFASSEWVYDRCEEGVSRTEEDFIDITRHTSEYALSKLVSEANLRQKFRHGFCPVTILRFGIIYGPRAENWSAVESLLHAVATQDQVNVGSRKTARRFIHVSDIAAAVHASIGLGGFEIINIQGREMISLGEIIDTSKRLLGRASNVIERTPEQVSLRPVSDQKAKKLIGWRAEIGLERGLQSVCDHLGLKTV